MDLPITDLRAPIASPNTHPEHILAETVATPRYKLGSSKLLHKPDKSISCEAKDPGTQRGETTKAAAALSSTEPVAPLDSAPT